MATQDNVLEDATSVVVAYVQTNDCTNDALFQALSVISSTIKSREAFSVHGITPQMIVHILGVTTSHEIASVACRILETMLAHTPLTEIIGSYKELAVAGLQSNLVEANKLVLGILHRGIASTCTDDASSLKILTQSELIPLVIRLVACDDCDVYQMVLQILQEIAKHEWTLDTLLSADNLVLLTQIHETNAVSKLRVYETLALISQTSTKAFMHLQNTPLLSYITHPPNTADILESLNQFEIITLFTRTSAGFVFLDQAGVLAWMYEHLERCASDAVWSEDVCLRLFGCACIKFWGFLIYNQNTHIPTIKQKYPILTLLNSFLASHQDVLECTLVAVSNIASTPLGLEWVCEHTGFVDLLMRVGRDSSGGTKVAFLRLVACMLDHTSTTPIQETTKQIYDKMATHIQPIPTLIRDAKSVDEDVCVSAYAALNAILMHAWGIAEMARTGALDEFVCQREFSASRIIKQWKYSLVKTVGEHPSRTTLPHHIQEKIMLYLRQGPMYTESQPAVAMESV